ncbi:multiple coagulation factor deficiency protein 2 homolog [Penaeus japonicus]|uniref:multiple coagulation factor deficiency protein 2 homolog n=1 Tax=Penaeus japonicus TaxID=27405 RepID=UPI001C70D4A0|nr:multiple coagulation factor deficiency protein 2 homolog [Penaeus japonicus]
MAPSEDKSLLRAWVLLALFAGVLTTGSGGGAGSHSHMRQHHHDRKEGNTNRHHHHRPKQTLENPKLLQDNHLVHDTDHMKEEMPEYMTPETIKNMSPRELDYHYFKLHDFDDNLRLDGLELLAALGHVHGDDDDDDDDYPPYCTHHNPPHTPYASPYKQLIDEVFEDNDTNKDGYLGWAEYLKGRQRNDEKRKQL